jgi:hypothetical protein
VLVLSNYQTESNWIYKMQPNQQIHSSKPAPPRPMGHPTVVAHTVGSPPLNLTNRSVSSLLPPSHANRHSRFADSQASTIPACGERLEHWARAWPDGHAWGRRCGECLAWRRGERLERQHDECPELASMNFSENRTPNRLRWYRSCRFLNFFSSPIGFDFSEHRSFYILKHQTESSVSTECPRWGSNLCPLVVTRENNSVLTWHGNTRCSVLFSSKVVWIYYTKNLTKNGMVRKMEPVHLIKDFRV